MRTGFDFLNSGGKSEIWTTNFTIIIPKLQHWIDYVSGHEKIMNNLMSLDLLKRKKKKSKKKEEDPIVRT